jgi:pimeloyl-ACP methyl ester carboxylesterase
MSAERIHVATSADGTMIAARVHGSGPPLVFVHGGPGDGEGSFQSLIPLLARHFSCYAMSTRGRALSADSPDHSRERLIEDIRAMLVSVAAPVAILAHSSGVPLAMEAAATSRAVAALVAFEPTLRDLADGETRAQGEAAVAKIRQAVEEGRPNDGARVFFEDLGLANEEELPVLAQAGVFEGVAANVAVTLQEIDQSGLPQLSDMAVLDRLSMPVLVLYGSRTHPFYTSVVRYLQKRAPRFEFCEIPEVGHLAPQLAPEPVAAETARFLNAVLASS